MKLNKNSRWLHYARIGKGWSLYLPSSLCPMFWYAIIGWISIWTSPAMFIFDIWNKEDDTIEEALWESRTSSSKEYANSGLYHFVLDKLMVFLLWITAIIHATSPNIDFSWWSLLYSPFITIGVIGVVIGIICVLIKIQERRKKEPSKKSGVIGTMFRSIRDKVCPLINWEE